MSEGSVKKYKKGRHMMATIAIHNLGDISRKDPDLCVITKEDENNYIGMWVTGFGFFDVKFPKDTTRSLTEQEKNKYIGRGLAINSNPIHYVFKKEDFEWDGNK